MIAPGAVLVAAQEVNDELTRVYGQVKHQEQGHPRPGETLQTAAEAQQALWPRIQAMADVMRRDLGVVDGISAPSRPAGAAHAGGRADMPSPATCPVP